MKLNVSGGAAPATEETEASTEQAASSNQLVEAKPQQVAVAQQVEDDFGMSAEELAAINQATNQNVNGSEIQISRLAILQTNSPEIQDKKPGFKDGMIVDNKTRTIYSEHAAPPWLVEKGVDPATVEAVSFVRFLPIFKLPNEFIHWKNRTTEGKGMHFKTLDEKDPRVRAGSFPPFGNWKPEPGSNVKAPPVTNNINLLGILVDALGNPISDYMIATFSKGNTNVGKKIITALQYLQGKPYWSMCFGLFTWWRKDDKGSYWALDAAVIKTGKRTPLSNQMCKTVALYLADKENGPARQEGFLNAAEPEQMDYQSLEAANAAAASGGHIPADGGDGDSDGEPNF